MKTELPDRVRAVIADYPEEALSYFTAMRTLVMEVAESLDCGAEGVEETLKWGEPSYLVDGGSTVRMCWKARAPSRFGIYFNCNTTLVETFRALYPKLKYEKNRAILLELEQPVPTDVIYHCISLALRYHLLKKAPTFDA